MVTPQSSTIAIVKHNQEQYATYANSLKSLWIQLGILPERILNGLEISRYEGNPLRFHSWKYSFVIAFTFNSHWIVYERGHRRAPYQELESAVELFKYSLLTSQMRGILKLASEINKSIRRVNLVNLFARCIWNSLRDPVCIYRCEQRTKKWIRHLWEYSWKGNLDG